MKRVALGITGGNEGGHCVKSCNLNPYWNESFVFIIDEMDMKRVTLEITVGP
jgi:hypothetical protein